MTTCAESLGLLIHPGTVAELRIPNAGPKHTISGYFDDIAKMVTTAERLSGRVPGVYFTLNPVLPDLLARANNRVIENARTTTTDSEIVKRLWLPIDFDARRSSGISSTDAEHESALEVARECRAFLRRQGWPDPIYADSGNGAHLDYRIDLPTESTQVRRVLEFLARRFNNGRVELDVKVFNPARIWKLYGTKVCKGDATQDRPHRVARILECPDPLALVTAAQMEALVATDTANPTPQRNNDTRSEFSLDEWLAKYDNRLPPLGVKKEWRSESGVGWKREFKCCPWDAEHTGSSAFVGCVGSGAVVAGCRHNSCSGRGWADLKAVAGDTETGQRRSPVRTTSTVVTSHAEHIRQFDQIPDIMTMTIPPMEYLVDGLIARGTITLWTGSDGTAKTFLAQKMSVAVASGSKFLGRRCHAAPVLYLDYENPSFAVRERLDVMAGGPVSGLKVWGTWLEQQPPQIGNELLLSIAKETKPLIIVDPFRYAHGAEENDSTAMMGVMQVLRYCAAAGGAVVILHHPAKTEGSTGRGSTVIKGAADVAFLQELSDESGLITLKCTKNRFGERMSVTIRPDYAEGTFEVEDSSEFTRRTAETEKLLKIITDTPGLSQNLWWKQSGMMKARFVALVKSNIGILWAEEKSGSSLRYIPTCSQTQNNSENNRTGQGVEAVSHCSQREISQDAENKGTKSCSSVLTSLGENREQLAPDPGEFGGGEPRTGSKQTAAGNRSKIAVGEIKL
jgi:hypothetical protein